MLVCIDQCGVWNPWNISFVFKGVPCVPYFWLTFPHEIGDKMEIRWTCHFCHILPSSRLLRTYTKDSRSFRFIAEFRLAAVHFPWSNRQPSICYTSLVGCCQDDPNRHAWTCCFFCQFCQPENLLVMYLNGQSWYSIKHKTWKNPSRQKKKVEKKKLSKNYTKLKFWKKKHGFHKESLLFCMVGLQPSGVKHSSTFRVLRRNFPSMALVQGVPTWASGNSAAWLGKPSFFCTENREGWFFFNGICFVGWKTRETNAHLFNWKGFLIF